MKSENLIAPEFYNITDEIAQFDSEKTALIWQDGDGVVKEWSYRHLLATANRFANVMAAAGIRKGDHVIVMMPRLLETYAVYMGIWLTGAIIIPASELLKAHDLEYRIHHADVKALIADASCTNEFDKIGAAPSVVTRIVIGADSKIDSWQSYEQLIDGAATQFKKVPTRKDDPCLLAFTSGTTGNPKGVVHAHGWGYAHIRIAADHWLDIRADDTVWATAGPGWQKWVWSPFLSVLGKGATGFIYNGRFRPAKQLELLQDRKVNVLCCTPTEYRLMAKADHLNTYDLSQLRSAVSAGEPLNREVITVFQDNFDLKVRDGYGQTESTLLIGTLVEFPIRPGSMGKPIMPEYMAIIDEFGKPVAVGEVGDIAIRKDFPALFQEYYKEPERLEKAIRGDYFVSGDRAYRDEDNYYWFQGRNDDIIISSGYTIGPFEVEDALTNHPSVKEVAVVASPDEIRGTVVKAFIVLKDGFIGDTELVKELQNFTKEHTAPYKYPRRIEFVESLPKTDSGKVRRVALRDAEFAKISQ
ncbi:acyl-CoA synthetase [Paenilisteria rocourtiae]|uniref:Acetyl-CoA synthetase n=1 Tax=Listeria rocourtiae TaxID=647910 RepID=A0A4R6ZGL0_9LIST|nr:acyl--CoA ligase [Listeria rocourtiae]EUJ52287.1 putative acyl--CoA ligase YtcI [Listeria rocourtiae FSL F6-920]MBC1605759.1 acyl--CoA ligase [Listeria rocourtiae]TDR51074.1 acetyl-CoA synthetase [Listeria rocourtiae]